MTIEVTNDFAEINLIPTTEIEEITQNIKTILGTAKGTVPLDRNFGVDSTLLDMPINAIQAKATANITTAINNYEPRARVKKVTFDGNNLEGLAHFTVTVEIAESVLRGGVGF